MRITLTLVFMAFFAAESMAQETEEVPEPYQPAVIRPAGEAVLSEFLWTSRPLIVFADAPADPRYNQQMEFLAEGLDELEDRDVIVLTDTDPAARSPLRQELRPRGFMLVLIGKDGVKYLRKPFPWHVREITRVIDKLPTRQQEIRDRRGGS